MIARPLTLLLAATVVAGACSSDAKKNVTKAAAGATSTTAAHVQPKPGGPLGILTHAAADAGAATRPALTVKVENTQLARPQSGLNDADIIYEEVVEGGYTRLAAIFQSHLPPVVGPVRSVRNTDQAIVRPLQGIFVYSGGAWYAEDSIATAPVVRLNESSAGSAMFRDHSRVAPHNLYLHPIDIFAKAPTAHGPPPAMFRFGGLAAGTGKPVTQATVGFLAGFAVTWNWDAPTRRFVRTIFGSPDIGSNRERLGATNVLIQQVRYHGGDRNGVGAEATLAGTGHGWVLTRGRVIEANWSRSDATKPGEWRDLAGGLIALAPGTTWIELPNQSYSVTFG